MPAETRQYQGDQTLLDIALDLHMYNMGSAPDIDHIWCIGVLGSALVYWKPNDGLGSEFDNQVRELILIVLKEYVQCTKQS